MGTDFSNFPLDTSITPTNSPSFSLFERYHFVHLITFVKAARKIDVRFTVTITFTIDKFHGTFLNMHFLKTIFVFATFVKVIDKIKNSAIIRFIVQIERDGENVIRDFLQSSQDRELFGQFWYWVDY